MNKTKDCRSSNSSESAIGNIKMSFKNFWQVTGESYHFIEFVSIAISYRPNGGNNQVCATEFDEEARGLRSPAGSWVITISV